MNSTQSGSNPTGDSKAKETSSESEKSKAKDDFDPVEYFNQKALRKSNTGRVVAGIILIAFGFIFLAERYFSYFNFEDFLPLILIAVGIILLWNSSKK